MTTPNHMIQSGLIQASITHKNYYLIVLAMLLAGWVDLLRLFQKDKSNWHLYNIVHLKEKPTNNKFLNSLFTAFILILPHTNLHVAEDYYLHDENGWKWYTKYIEVVLWMLMIVYTWKTYV